MTIDILCETDRFPWKCALARNPQFSVNFTTLMSSVNILRLFWPSASTTVGEQSSRPSDVITYFELHRILVINIKMKAVRSLWNFYEFFKHCPWIFYEIWQIFINQQLNSAFLLWIRLVPNTMNCFHYYYITSLIFTYCKISDRSQIWLYRLREKPSVTVGFYKKFYGNSSQ